MDFGVLVFPKPDRCAEQAQLAERVGFNHVWVEDSPMANDRKMARLFVDKESNNKITRTHNLTKCGPLIKAIAVHDDSNLKATTLLLTCDGKICLTHGTRS